MRTDRVRLGRLSGERKGEIMTFLSSMHADRCIADADVLVDLAHVLMLDNQKIIDREITRKLLPALLKLFDEGVPDEVFDDRFEDVHAGIEAFLIESVGIDAGGRMHMGRSRNDEVATCIRIRLREELLGQMSALLRVREVLVTIAGLHTGTAMPGFTHMQHAQPTTLAHYLLSYEGAFSRDFDRLRDAYVRVNRSPLGSAAFASTGYPVNREFTAALLGFDGLVINSMDAVAARDFALEILADFSILMATVSRLCEDLIFWSTSFVKFVSLDDAFCSTSSIMPQKKNPDTAEIMRAKSGSVFGAFAGAIMTVKGLPMSYNRDLRLLTDMLSSATFDPERMKEEAGKGFSTATELADTLVRNYGLPFRTAHNIVGRAVQKGNLSLATLEESAQEVGGGISLLKKGLTQKNIDDVLDVNFSISVRGAPGGPAPSSVKIALEDTKKQIGKDSAYIDHRVVKLKNANEELIKKARELVA